MGLEKNKVETTPTIATRDDFGEVTTMLSSQFTLDVTYTSTYTFNYK